MTVCPSLTICGTRQTGTKLRNQVLPSPWEEWVCSALDWSVLPWSHTHPSQVAIAQQCLHLPSPTSTLIPPGTSLLLLSGEHVASSLWPWDKLLPICEIWRFTQSTWLGSHSAAKFLCYREGSAFPCSPGALPVSISSERQLDLFLPLHSEFGSPAVQQTPAVLGVCSVTPRLDVGHHVSPSSRAGFKFECEP